MRGFEALVHHPQRKTNDQQLIRKPGTNGIKEVSSPPYPVWQNRRKISQLPHTEWVCTHHRQKRPSSFSIPVPQHTSYSPAGRPRICCGDNQQSGQISHTQGHVRCTARKRHPTVRIAYTNGRAVLCQIDHPPLDL